MLRGRRPPFWLHSLLKKRTAASLWPAVAALLLLFCLSPPLPASSLSYLVRAWHIINSVGRLLCHALQTRSARSPVPCPPFLSPLGALLPSFLPFPLCYSYFRSSFSIRPACENTQMGRILFCAPTRFSCFRHTKAYLDSTTQCIYQDMHPITKPAPQPRSTSLFLISSCCVVRQRGPVMRQAGAGRGGGTHIHGPIRARPARTHTQTHNMSHRECEGNPHASALPTRAAAAGACRAPAAPPPCGGPSDAA